MSSRRHLVQRPQRAEDTPTRRPRQSAAPSAAQTSALPPYEAPAQPLTAAYQRKLADISSSRDYSKYKKHLEVAIKNVTNCAAESNDRLSEAKTFWNKQVEKRQAANGAVDGEQEAEKSEIEERAEQRATELEEKVDRLTEEAEKALRDLIDYRDEMAQQENMLQMVSDDAVTRAVPTLAENRRGAPSKKARRRQRDGVEDDSDDEDMDGDATFENDEMSIDEDDKAAAAEAAVLSPTELLRKAKEEYSTTYTARSMRSRYAENNDYKGFKQVVHDARNPGPNAPSVPHARTWFPSDNTTDTPASRRRRLAASTGNGDDDDDDIQFAGAISDLKCPLTLQTFKEPYSNRVCKHTFEKSAIIEFHNDNAASVPDPSQGGRRGRNAPQPQGPKMLRCPQHGCEAMLEMKDFYDDQIVLRQVRRAAAQAAAEMEEGLEDEEESGVEDIEVADDDDTGVDVEDITEFAD